MAALAPLLELIEVDTALGPGFSPLEIQVWGDADERWKLIEAIRATSVTNAAGRVRVRRSISCVADLPECRNDVRRVEEMFGGRTFLMRVFLVCSGVRRGSSLTTTPDSSCRLQTEISQDYRSIRTLFGQSLVSTGMWLLPFFRDAVAEILLTASDATLGSDVTLGSDYYQ